MDFLIDFWQTAPAVVLWRVVHTGCLFQCEAVSQTQPSACQPVTPRSINEQQRFSLRITTQKRRLKATGLLLVIACTEILMSSFFRCRRLRYLPLTDERCQNKQDCLLLTKAAVEALCFKNHVGRGRVTILRREQFATIFISPWTVPSLLLFLRELFYVPPLFLPSGAWKEHVLLLIPSLLPLCFVCWAQHLHGCDLSPLCGSHVIPRRCYLS